MKLFKNNIFLGLLISLITSSVGYVLLHSYQFGICYSNIETQTFAASCRFAASFWGGQLFLPSLALALIFLVLLFTPQAVRAWGKFAWWGIPLGAFLIYQMALASSGGGFNIFPPLDISALRIGQTYVGISLGIIGTAALSVRRVHAGARPLRWWWYVAASIAGMFLIMNIVPPLLNALGAISAETANRIDFPDTLLFYILIIIALFNTIGLI